jgi:hypothetical protein
VRILLFLFVLILAIGGCGGPPGNLPQPPSAELLHVMPSGRDRDGDPTVRCFRMPSMQEVACPANWRERIMCE